MPLCIFLDELIGVWPLTRVKTMASCYCALVYEGVRWSMKWATDASRFLNELIDDRTHYQHYHSYVFATQ